jgi:hypothetical protein
MEATTEQKTKYVGIADCHGIESFHLATEGDTNALFKIRANCNRQRHAVYYEAELNADGAEKVIHKLQDKDFTGALEALKFCAENVVLSGEDDVAQSWELIPNKDLDPWA